MKLGYGILVYVYAWMVVGYSIVFIFRLELVESRETDVFTDENQNKLRSWVEWGLAVIGVVRLVEFG